MAFDRAAWQRAYRRKYPERVREYNHRYRSKKQVWQRADYTRDPAKYRRYNFKYRYGISESTKVALLLMQGNMCAICKVRQPMHLDHCHATSKVRGVLCPGCNHAIGFMEDNPEWLRLAASYIEENG